MRQTASEPSSSKKMPQIASESNVNDQNLSLLLMKKPLIWLFQMSQAKSCAVVLGCANCAQLLKENRQLTNRVKTWREIVGKRHKEVRAYHRKCENNNYWYSVFPYINLNWAFVIYIVLSKHYGVKSKKIKNPMQRAQRKLMSMRNLLNTCVQTVIVMAMKWR